jgi:hypothetical protein
MYNQGTITNISPEFLQCHGIVATLHSFHTLSEPGITRRATDFEFLAQAFVIAY